MNITHFIQRMRATWFKNLRAGPDRILSQFSMTLGLRLFFLGNAFLIRLILARWLGVDGLGTYYYALAWVDVLLIVSVFGIDRLLVRELSAARAKERWDLAQGLLRFANRVPLILSVGIMLLAMFAVSLSPTDTDTLVPGFARAALLIAFLLIPLRTMIRIRQGSMQAFDQIGRSQLPEYVMQPLVFLLMLGVVWLLWGVLSPALALILYVASHVVTYIYGEYLLRRAIPGDVKGQVSQYEIRAWLYGGFALLFLNGMNIISNRIDVLMLGWLGSAASIGIYSTAAQLANLVALVLMAANTTLAPNFARLYELGKLDQLQQMVTRSARLVLAGSVLIGGGLMLLGAFALRIFGPEFVAGQAALNILVIGQFINAATGSAGVLLIMTKHGRYTGVALGIGILLNALLNLLLIPSYGIDGAAFANMLSVVVANTLLVVFIWKKLNIISVAIGTFWKA